MGKTLLAKSLGFLFIGSLLAGAHLTQAQVRTNGLPAAKKELPGGGVAQKEAPKRYPYSGTLAAVDPKALTITLNGKAKQRVLRVTATTRMTKDGKPATLANGVVGEEVAGQIVKAADGTEYAASIRFGPKPESPPKRP